MIIHFYFDLREFLCKFSISETISHEMSQRSIALDAMKMQSPNWVRKIKALSDWCAIFLFTLLSLEFLLSMVGFRGPPPSPALRSFQIVQRCRPIAPINANDPVNSWLLSHIPAFVPLPELCSYPDYVIVCHFRPPPTASRQSNSRTWRLHVKEFLHSARKYKATC